MSEYKQHMADFMKAVEGIRSEYVAVALSRFTGGTSWRDCSNSYMAECYADSKCNIAYRGC